MAPIDNKYGSDMMPTFNSHFIYAVFSQLPLFGIVIVAYAVMNMMSIAS